MSVCEFQEHAGNCAHIAAVLHVETKSNNGPNEAGKEGGGHSCVFSGQKIAGLTKQCAWTHHHGESGLVFQLFQMYWVAWFPESLQCLMVATLVIRLAWSNKLLMNSALITWMLTNFMWSFPMFELRKALSFLFSLWNFHQKHFEHSAHFHCSVPKLEAQLNTNVCIRQMHFCVNYRGRGCVRDCLFCHVWHRICT